MSSTNEGNPPMVMKVKNEATNMIIDPFACSKVEIIVITREFLNICEEMSAFDRTVASEDKDKAT